MHGNEWVCGSKIGGPGDSMRVNMSTGKWADFATDDKGGDLISLLACIEGVKQIDAAKKLIQAVNYRKYELAPYVPPLKTTKKKSTDTIIKPPANLNPKIDHFKYGPPSMSWVYRDADGTPFFWVARYDISGKGKEFFPWSYSQEKNRVIMKGWPEPRPLFNLDKLANNPQKPVMIVEGEKSVIGAERLGAEQNYVITTWSNGSKAWRKAKWDVLKGRNILFWPDADEPGLAAALGISDLLAKICNQVKIIQPERSDGWDAWDAWQEEKSWTDVIEWAKRKVVIHKLADPRKVEEDATEEHAVDAEIVETEDDEKKIKHEVSVRVEPEQAPLEENKKKSLEDYGVALNARHIPYQSISNISRIFTNVEIFQGHFWYDQFDYRSYTDLYGAPHEIGDPDILKITALLQREWGVPTIRSGLVHEALTLCASMNPRHSVRDWISSLEWDGEKRIDQFFPDYLGADKNEYTEAVSRNFWIGMVARVFNPGCKNDYMVVLEGPQGVGKSMALASIGGKWHTESTESFGSKDFFQALHGKIIIEIAELDSFSRAEVTRVKQVVTAQHDRFRVSYGRTATDYPRQCIFVGSTNEFGYLRDSTGARRFWPIKCDKINIDKINNDRSQLFAEAGHRYKNGDLWHIVPYELAQAEQEARYQHDEIEVAVLQYLLGKPYIIMIDLAREALSIDPSKFDKRIQIRIAAILRREGWTPRREYLSGMRIRAWAPKQLPAFGDQALFGKDEVAF